MSRGRILAGLAVLGALAGAGMVSAQPAPQQGQPPLLQVPAPATPGPNGGAQAPRSPPPDEEAPPAQVAAPPPVAAPPISAEEVEAAPPPKAQVAVKPTEAAKRARYDVAVIQALDKVSAESMRFEAAVGRPVRYKNLVFTVKACERSASDEAVEDAIAHVTVESQPRAAPGKPTPPPRQAFRGWMYASSPGLNPLEHPIYDAWLITCRAATPGPTAVR
ncbi:DUF2155 domain-containing protein [Phenylobacterium sp.]|uniref:DUF2155 domain-containing protein n=1 Tax=Phenylobacterium sp. TaxID=1871053 RepID=UPI00289C6653|nr:DUF2155 domain-containing protein [Phenylobacterium sp.]